MAHYYGVLPVCMWSAFASSGCQHGYLQFKKLCSQWQWEVSIFFFLFPWPFLLFLCSPLLPAWLTKMRRGLVLACLLFVCSLVVVVQFSLRSFCCNHSERSSYFLYFFRVCFCFSFGSLVVVVQLWGSQQVVPQPNPGLDVAQDHTFGLFVWSISEMDLRSML